MEYRLHYSKDIQAVYDQGVKLHHPLLRCIAKRTSLPQSRFTVITSTRVHKHAVVRNRIKRRIRAVVRKELNTVPHQDLLFIAQPKAASATAEELVTAVQQLLQKAKQL